MKKHLIRWDDHFIFLNLYDNMVYCGEAGPASEKGMPLYNSSSKELRFSSRRVER